MKREHTEFPHIFRPDVWLTLRHVVSPCHIARWKCKWLPSETFVAATFSFSLSVCALAKAVSIKIQWIEWEIYLLETEFYFYRRKWIANEDEREYEHIPNELCRIIRFSIEKCTLLTFFYMNRKQYMSFVCYSASLRFLFVCSFARVFFSFRFIKLNTNYSLSRLFLVNMIVKWMIR